MSEQRTRAIPEGYWQGRTRRAEAERDALRTALEKIKARSAHSIGRGLTQCYEIADEALRAREALGDREGGDE